MELPVLDPRQSVMLPPPAHLVELVTEDVARILVANAQVLARQCAEACIRQVFATCSPAQSPDLARLGYKDSLLEAQVLAHQEMEAWQSPRGSDDYSDLQVEAEGAAHGAQEAPAPRKGRGKGPAGRRPPAKVLKSQLPAAAPKAGRRGSGMTELLQRVAAEGERKDREEAKEIEDLDLSQISSSPPPSRTRCPRCEQEVLTEHFESHRTSHSSEILPWLFVGGKRNLDNEKELTTRTGISHVLNLAQEVNIWEDVVKFVTEYNAERGLEFVYKKIGLGDTPDQDILSDMDGALQFIHDAHSASSEHKVLVNCVQGISRSASVVLAYLMKYERMSLAEAHTFLREKRPIAEPRQEFLVQLGAMECQIFGRSHPSLKAEEVFAGRRMLNVDGSPVPVQQQDDQPSGPMHDLEALQQAMQNLNSQLQVLGAEADSAAQKLAERGLGGGANLAELRGDNETALVAKRYVAQLTLPPRVDDEGVCPELRQERDACEALVDFMARAAAALLDERDHLRARLPAEGWVPPEGDSRGEESLRPLV